MKMGCQLAFECTKIHALIKHALSYNCVSNLEKSKQLTIIPGALLNHTAVGDEEKKTDYQR